MLTVPLSLFAFVRARHGKSLPQAQDILKVNRMIISIKGLTLKDINALKDSGAELVAAVFKNSVIIRFASPGEASTCFSKTRMWPYGF